MLVLSRKIGEKIVIGNGIVITVLDLNGQRIRLGIQAPDFIAIRREELAPLQANAASESRAVRPLTASVTESLRPWRKALYNN